MRDGQSVGNGRDPVVRWWVRGDIKDKLGGWETLNEETEGEGREHGVKDLGCLVWETPGRGWEWREKWVESQSKTGTLERGAWDWVREREDEWT